jgi:hypothetical protein
MRPHRHARRTRRAACTLALLACALVVATSPAAAHVPYDFAPGTPATYAGTPTTADKATIPDKPPIVRNAVVAHDTSGPGTLGFALIGVSTILALLGAGYLGARISSNHPRRPAT